MNPTNPTGPSIPRSRTRTTERIEPEPWTPEWLREQYRKDRRESR